jgi:acetoin utilization deacetylase AcuC-like enzyme
MLAFDEIMTPAVRRFAPDLIVVANGLDAGQFDPNGRALVTTSGFHALARRTRALAIELSGGRLVAVLEGGYSAAHAPFCLLATWRDLRAFRCRSAIGCLTCLHSRSGRVPTSTGSRPPSLGRTV